MEHFQSPYDIREKNISKGRNDTVTEEEIKGQKDSNTITNEQLKYDGQDLAKGTSKFFNNVIVEENVSRIWKTSVTLKQICTRKGIENIELHDI